MKRQVIFIFLGLSVFMIGCQSLATDVQTTTAATTPGDILTPIIEHANAASTGCQNPVPDDRRFPLPPWPKTNFCLHSVPYEEIQFGGQHRDRIPSIDAPVFHTIEEADIWLADIEPVIAFQVNGDVRAYPLQVLVWHEIVNDVVDGDPVVITYCPLCNSALVFDRTIDDRVLDFGVSGNLRDADLLMYDRQSESWWQQFTGEAIVGDATGKRLELLPSSIVSYGDFKKVFINGKVLFPDFSGDNYERVYGETPYTNYDSLVNPSTQWLDGEPDSRLVPKMRVLALELGETAVAYPYSILEEMRVVNDDQNGRPLVIFWNSGTTSALYNKVISNSKDVGSAAAYSRLLDDRLLTFQAVEGGFRDQETDSTWNIFGIAFDGPLAGKKLVSLNGNEILWFAWANFHPDTLVYELPA